MHNKNGKRIEIKRSKRHYLTKTKTTAPVVRMAQLKDLAYEHET